MTRAVIFFLLLFLAEFSFAANVTHTISMGTGFGLNPQLSPNKQLVAVNWVEQQPGQSGNEIRVYAVNGGHLVHKWSWPSAPHFGLPLLGLQANMRFSPDNLELVMGNNAGDLWSWDIGGGIVIRRFGRFQGSIGSIDIVLPPGRGGPLLIATDEKHTLVFDYVSGKEIFRWPHQPLSFGFHFPYSVLGALSPDGQWAATVSIDGIVRMWSLLSGREVLLGNNNFLAQIHQPKQTSQHPYLEPMPIHISFSNQSDIRVLDYEGGNQSKLYRINRRGIAGVRSVSQPYYWSIGEGFGISRDNGWMVTGTSFVPPTQSFICAELVDLNRNQSHLLRGPLRKENVHVALSEDGTTAVTSMNTGELLVWDLP